MKIFADTCDGLSHGTGFLVGRRFVVTANHVASDAEKITLVSGRKKLGSATVVGSNVDKDVALLRTSRPIPGYVFAFAGRARNDENVAVLGYPERSRRLKLTQGFIENRGVAVDTEDGIHRRGLFQISEGVPPGISGSPLLRRTSQAGEEGDVVGLVISSGTGADETYAVPAPVVAAKVSVWRKAPRPVQGPMLEAGAEGAAALLGSREHVPASSP